MPEFFSYLQHPVLSCLNLIPEIFNGIEKVVAFYYDNHTENIKSALILSDNDYSNVAKVDISDKILLISKLREHSKNASWFAEDELDFDIQGPRKVKQLDIKSEDKKKVLKLCFHNNNDGNRDLIYIYFNSLSNVIPLTDNKKKLDTIGKSIIQHMAEKMLGAFLRNEIKNKQNFEKISLSARNIIKEADDIKRKLSQTREKYGDSLVNLCEMHLRRAEMEFNKRFSFEFDTECVQKIKTYNGKIDDLQKIINNAVSYLANIYYNTPTDHIQIHDYHIHFDKVMDQRVSELKESGFKDYDSETFVKEITILNRYEEAVRKLMNDGRKVTINAVGECCHPKVTGAAISDAISKNINNFNKLFEKYPNNWTYLRTHLKPITNKIVTPSFYKTKQA